MMATSIDYIKINTKIPHWLPASIVDTLLKEAPVEYRGTVSTAERQVFIKKKHISVSKWSERHRVLTMSSLPGNWKNEVTPYLRGIMDSSFFPSVQTIIICKAPQTGGSEAVHNCIGYAIDRNPGPVLYVYPDIETAKENSQDRIQPMIESSGRLRNYLTGRVDDLSINRINLNHMPIYLAWARSASRLGNKPIKYVVFDETDKYPLTSGKYETDPISLGEKRTQTFKWNRKIWKISTPTVENGPIWQAFQNEAQVRFDFWVRCELCQEFQHMKFSQIKFPKDERDPETIELKRLAHYECEFCHGLWDDDLRNKSVRKGRWQDRESGTELNKFLKRNMPSKIAFHIPAWLSYFVSLSEICASFLKSNKNKNKLKDYKNNYEAIPWIEYTIERAEDRIFELKDERSRMIVPEGNIVSCMTAGIDTQQDGFWFEVRAWGWGHELESWQVREGFLQSFDDLAMVLWDDVYRDVDNNEYRIILAIIDAMGGVTRTSSGSGTRTAEVYDFCRKYRGLISPYKGERTMSEPWRYSKLDRYPDGKHMTGSIMLVRADTNYYKYELDRKLDISSGDPGAWHMHTETTMEWASQMVAEGIDENGFWINPHGRANHAWDCSVLNLVAADILRVKAWRKKNFAKQIENNPVMAKKESAWIPKVDNWLNR